MIINTRLTEANVANIWVYPVNLRFEWTKVPADFEKMPPHRMLLALTEIPEISLLVETQLAADEKLFVHIRNSLDDLRPPQPVDIDAYNLISGRVTTSDALEMLHAVFHAYPAYSDPNLGGGSFEDMVQLFANDDFYELHHVAAEYLAFNEAEGSPAPLHH